MEPTSEQRLVHDTYSVCKDAFRTNGISFTIIVNIKGVKRVYVHLNFKVIVEHDQKVAAYKRVRKDTKSLSVLDTVSFARLSYTQIVFIPWNCTLVFQKKSSTSDATFSFFLHHQPKVG